MRPDIDARFDGVDARLDKVDSRLDKVDSRLDKVDSRLDKVDSRLDKVDSRLDKVDSRLDKVDLRLDKVDSRLDKVDSRLDGLGVEIVRTRAEMATKSDVAEIQGQLGRMTGMLDGILGWMRDQDRTVVVYDAILREHRVRLDDHSRRLGSLEADA